MAMLVLILDTRDSRATIDAATAERLAELGVTRVTVARDTVTEAVVLEGWAFDAQSSAAEAARLVAGPDPARSLKPVLQTLLHQLARPHRSQRRPDDGARDPVPGSRSYDHLHP